MSSILGSIGSVVPMRRLGRARGCWLAVLGLGLPLALPAAEPATAILVDVRPFFPRPEFRQSLVVSIRAEGKVRAVNYAPNALAVLAVREGTVPQGEAERFFSRAGESGIRGALEGGRASAGMGREGDPFSLWVQSQGRSWMHCGGQVQEAPASMQGLVEDLLALWKRLEAAPLAEAFLRAVPVEKERLEQMRKEGKPPLIPTSELAPGLQPLVADAVHRPLDFVPLSKSQQEFLQARGQQFFVASADSAYELTLFVKRK